MCVCVCGVCVRERVMVCGCCCFISVLFWGIWFCFLVVVGCFEFLFWGRGILGGEVVVVGGGAGVVVGSQERHGGHEELFPNDYNARTEETALDRQDVVGT